ncbi:XRE family transcriptional regulator [Streptomyces sp. NPDC007861]|uniref:XRE family transcriptional regulator n=1 Tax=Streptomyces sp. NPDC007861 TaxID=3154893 RepID=UPI0033D26970
MTPGHVAYGLQAQYGIHVAPDIVVAWERGTLAPASHELTALAGVLWCAPGDLLGAARSLREHRIARAIDPEELARLVGMEASAYRTMEDTDRWRGSERQTAALAEALALSPRELLTATGRNEEFAELLRSAATTRWQAYVRPVARVLAVPRRQVESALRQMHADYQARMVTTSSWGASGGSGEAGKEYLERVVDHFWELAPDR